MCPAMYSPADRPSRAGPPRRRSGSGRPSAGSPRTWSAAKGLPVFSHSARTSSSARASMASAIRSKARLRSDGVARFHAANAAAAAPNARSTSRARHRRLGERLAGARVDDRRAWPSIGSDVLPPDEVAQPPHRRSRSAHIAHCVASRVGGPPRSTDRPQDHSWSIGPRHRHTTSDIVRKFRLGDEFHLTAVAYQNSN